MRGRAAKGKDLMEGVRTYARRSGEIRRKLRKAGPGLSPERVRSFREAFLGRLGLKIAASTRSGKDGLFRFSKVSLPRGDEDFLALLAEPPGGYLPSDPVRVKSSFLGPGKGPDLVLLRPASVRGMVLAWPGGGRTGTVAAWRLGPGRVLEQRRRFYFGKGSFDFKLDNLHPGKWRLALLSRRGRIFFSWGPLLDLREGEVQQGIVLKGETPSSLEVFAYGPGKSPLQLAVLVTIALRAAGPPGKEGEQALLEESFGPALVRPGRSARTDLLSPGRFRITGEIEGMVPPRSPFTRAASKREEKSPYRVEKEIVLKGGSNQVDLVFPRLPPRLDLQVWVKDPAGRPVEKGSVRLWPRFRWGVAGDSREAPLEPGGKAFFRNLFPAKFRVRVAAPGFWPVDRVLDLSKCKDPDASREYTLHKAARIEGRVVDGGGKPVPGARVLVVWKGERGTGRPGPLFSSFTRMAVTGKDGRFVEEVAQGEYFLRFLASPANRDGKQVEVRWGETVKVELRAPGR